MARHAGERWGHALLARRGASRAGRGSDTEGTTRNEETGHDSPDRHPDADAGSAGREDPAAAVVDLLDELRFEPQPSAGAVRLTTCPLLDAARRNPDLVCQVHLGIVRGVLGELGADPDAADLVPFAEPGACRLTLPGLQ